MPFELLGALELRAGSSSDEASEENSLEDEFVHETNGGGLSCPGSIRGLAPRLAPRG